MRLADFKKPTSLTFDAPEGEPKPVIFMRLAENEFTLKLQLLQDELREKLGLAPGADIPDEYFTGTLIRSYVGTYAIGWRHFEDDSGQPLNDRNDDGSLNEANGVSILSVSEVWQEVGDWIKAKRAEKEAALEAARGNSPAPSPVN